MSEENSNTECSCTEHAKLCAQKQKNREVYAEGRFGKDKEGNILCTVDSFGFRGSFEGECSNCRQKYIDGYNNAMKATFDDY